jgi:uncharacterized protein (DUF2141 family)
MILKKCKQNKHFKFALQYQLMKVSHFLNLLLIITLGSLVTVSNSGCGQIGAISGGLKDTLPPALLAASPKLLSTNITDNKITLTFDEYVDELQEVQSNVLVSPYPKTFPEFKSKLKTISVKLKDTLLPNTTYAINFGKAIRDVNEGNVLKNFTYVFSTGNTIDSLSLSGKVELAETGKADSTMIVMLYRNANDSSVQQVKPAYIAFLKGDGSFTFNNLPPGNFNIYALKDGDGGKTYNSKTEEFAFADRSITVSANNKPIALFAYAEEKTNKTPLTTTVKPKTAAQKKLKYTLGSGGQKQDIRQNFILDFNNAIKQLDTTKITLTDTNFVPVPGVSFAVDSNKVILKTKWLEDADYKIVIQKGAVRDSTDSTITKTDTIRFKTRGSADYGNVVLRFNGIELSKHPVLQFVQDDVVKESYPVTAKEWQNKLFTPGEYEIRILYDDNNNGKWDPGSYSKKLQPEKVIALPKKFAVKENWDNESDINL